MKITDFYNAFWFIAEHPKFQKPLFDDETESMIDDIFITVQKVNPKTKSIDDDKMKNTHTEIWLESQLGMSEEHADGLQFLLDEKRKQIAEQKEGYASLFKEYGKLGEINATLVEQLTWRKLENEHLRTALIDMIDIYDETPRMMAQTNWSYFVNKAREVYKEGLE